MFAEDNEYRELPQADMKFMLDGLCVGMPTSWFFRESGKRVPKQAREACANCEVSEKCLAWAMEFEDFGFWAGTTGDERKAMRRLAAA